MVMTREDEELLAAQMCAAMRKTPFDWRAFRLDRERQAIERAKQRTLQRQLLRPAIGR
jgi:hypothetical protein